MPPNKEVEAGNMVKNTETRRKNPVSLALTPYGRRRSQKLDPPCIPQAVAPAISSRASVHQQFPQQGYSQTPFEQQGQWSPVRPRSRSSQRKSKEERNKKQNKGNNVVGICLKFFIIIIPIVIAIGLVVDYYLDDSMNCSNNLNEEPKETALSPAQIEEFQTWIEKSEDATREARKNRAEAKAAELTAKRAMEVVYKNESNKEQSYIDKKLKTFAKQKDVFIKELNIARLYVTTAREAWESAKERTRRFPDDIGCDGNINVNSGNLLLCNAFKHADLLKAATEQQINVAKSYVDAITANTKLMEQTLKCTETKKQYMDDKRSTSRAKILMDEATAVRDVQEAAFQSSKAEKNTAAANVELMKVTGTPEEAAKAIATLEEASKRAKETRQGHSKAKRDALYTTSIYDEAVMSEAASLAAKDGCNDVLTEKEGDVEGKLKEFQQQLQLFDSKKNDVSNVPAIATFHTHFNSTIDVITPVSSTKKLHYITHLKNQDDKISEKLQNWKTEIESIRIDARAAILTIKNIDEYSENINTLLENINEKLKAEQAEVENISAELAQTRAYVEAAVPDVASGAVLSSLDAQEAIKLKSAIKMPSCDKIFCIDIPEPSGGKGRFAENVAVHQLNLLMKSIDTKILALKNDINNSLCEDNAERCLNQKISFDLEVHSLALNEDNCLSIKTDVDCRRKDSCIWNSTGDPSLCVYNPIRTKLSQIRVEDFHEHARKIKIFLQTGSIILKDIKQNAMKANKKRSSNFEKSLEIIEKRRIALASTIDTSKEKAEAMSAKIAAQTALLRQKTASLKLAQELCKETENALASLQADFQAKQYKGIH